MTECRDKSLKQIQIFLRTVLINFWMFHELHLLTFIYRISDERHEDKQRWQTDRVSEQRRQWAEGVGNSAWVTAFIIKKPDRKGNGMIAPHHPSSSLFPPSLALPALFVGHPSDCISSGQFSVVPVHPFTTSPLLRPTSVRLEKLPHLLRREEEGAGVLEGHT